MKIRKIDVTDIEGFNLGNAENAKAGTGCTVIICEDGAVAGVDVRGGGPATRETDMLRSENTVETINAVVLSGGSAFGLEAASGVMRYLRDRKVGFSVGDITVPLVTGASLFDLAVGENAFPDVEMGIEACRNAYNGVFSNGNHGAGTGASCGKILGMERAMKTGLGTFACGDDYIQVGAISAVNACADIYNGAGNIIAGLRNADGTQIQGCIRVLKGMIHSESEHEMSLDDIKAIAKDEKTRNGEVKEENPADIAAAMQAAFEARTAEPEPAAEPAPEPDFEPETAAPEPAEEPAAPEPAPAAEPTVPEPAPQPAAESIAAEIHETAIPERATISAASSAAIAAALEEAASLIKAPVTAAVSETVTTPEPAAEPESVAEPVPEVRETEPSSSEYAEPAAAPAITAEPEPAPEPSAEQEPEPAAEREPEPAAEPETEEEFDDDDMGYDVPFNTTISCLITNAKLTKSQANKLASILHDAYARAIKPVHSTLDGDTIFVMATGKQEVNFDAFAALATDVMQYAIIDGAISAESAYGLPASRDINHK